MTILEKKSARKRASILNLVQKGEYSAAYALMLVEQLSDDGKLTETDYEELAEYLENLLNEETTDQSATNEEENVALDVEEESTENAEESGEA